MGSAIRVHNDSTVTRPFATNSFEAVAKSIKALNHEGHEGHKGKEKLFFVLFVSFVVPFFSESFAMPSFGKMIGGRCFLSFCLSPYSLMSTSRINTDFTQAIALQDRGGVEKTAWMISIRADVLGRFSARNLLRINLSNTPRLFVPSVVRNLSVQVKHRDIRFRFFPK